MRPDTTKGAVWPTVELAALDRTASDIVCVTLLTQKGSLRTGSVNGAWYGTLSVGLRPETAADLTLLPPPVWLTAKQ